MTQKAEIAELNIAIDIFMTGREPMPDKLRVGFVKRELGKITFSQIIPVTSLQYDTSFDALMPVVEKIESLGYSFWIQHEKNSNYITIWNSNKIIVKHEAASKLEAIFTAVCAFVEWYNKEGKKG